MALIMDAHSRTVDAIYALHAARSGAEAERGYLGLSKLGEDCERQLWYGFRWANKPEEITGRKARLFDTGHREEARLIAELRAIGVTVWDVDQDGKQWAVEAVDGHVRGHLDGVLLGVPEAPKTPHLFENKTMKAEKFRALVKVGLLDGNPVYYAQCQGYMHLMGLTRCLFLCISKDTDEIYQERVEYDHEFALRLMARGARIVNAARPPTKPYSPDDHRCHPAFCPARGICHDGQFARVNCRTCMHATPAPGGRWHCAVHGTCRSPCPDHRYIPDLVPGFQVDSNPAMGTISYRLRDGREWIDGDQT